MSRFFLTGDCHGEFKKIEFFCQHQQTTKDDYMIILGDAGINFCMDSRDEKLKNRLDRLPLSFLCIHGNHEERPFNIPTYREKLWHGGIVYYEDAHPTLLFAKDGEIYDLNGKKAVAIGGAYSADKQFRIMLGLPWFPDEQPSKATKIFVEKQLEQENWKVDYVFSHTCPFMYKPREKYQDILDTKEIDESTEQWLDEIAAKLTHSGWYFGHYHDNLSYNDAELLYEAIKELGSVGYLQKVGRPKYRTGEYVLFSVSDTEDGYGIIKKVYEYGTEEQYREVSYYIEGIICGNPDQKRRFKNIRESVVESINELMTE